MVAAVQAAHPADLGRRRRLSGRRVHRVMMMTPCASTSLAADLAARLRIEEHDVIRLCVRTDRNRVAALMVRAIDQDSFSKAPATTREPAGQTRTSGLPRFMQRVISRRPLVREISVDRMSYKNASAKQTHDYRDGLSHSTHPYYTVGYV